MRITELFDNGTFVVTAEVGPPKGIHIAPVVEEAKTHLSGITAVNVTDNQSSVMRMGSLPACVALQNGIQTGILQGHAGGQTAHAHDRGLVIGDVDTMNLSQILFGFFHEMLDVNTFGRADFCGNGKFTTFK